MTSIFNTYYSQNLSRLNSSSTEKSDDKAKHADGGEKFARVLGDIEENKKNPSNLADSAKIATAPKEAREYINPPSKSPNTISNFELIDQPPLSNTSIAPTVISSLTGGNTPLQSVKFNPAPVKFLAPESVSTPFNLPVPARPVIAEANRIAPRTPPKAELSPEVNAGLGTAAVGNKEGVRPGVPKLTAVRREADSIATPKAVAQNPHSNIKEIIETAGKFYGIDPNLGMAIAQTESSFVPTARSKDGHDSKGIFQLLDSTGKDMLGHTGIDEHYDPFDPAQNTYLGVGYLRRLHDIFSVETNLGGNMRTVPATSAEHLEKLAVAAYNAGEGNVARAQARARSLGKDPTDFNAVEPHLPASTRSYVKKVTELRDVFAARTAKSEIV